MFLELASKFQVDTLYKGISILTNTQQEMRFSNHAKVYLETAIIRLAHVPVEGTYQVKVTPSLEIK